MKSIYYLFAFLMLIACEKQMNITQDHAVNDYKVTIYGIPGNTSVSTILLNYTSEQKGDNTFSIYLDSKDAIINKIKELKDNHTNLDSLVFAINSSDKGESVLLYDAMIIIAEPTDYWLASL